MNDMCPEYLSKLITLKNVPIYLRSENNIIIKKVAFVQKVALTIQGRFIGVRYLMMRRNQTVSILLNLVYENGYQSVNVISVFYAK